MSFLTILSYIVLSFKCHSGKVGLALVMFEVRLPGCMMFFVANAF